MAERRIEPILAEIIEALDGIATATAGKTLDDFHSDWLLRRGVERGIAIVRCEHSSKHSIIAVSAASVALSQGAIV
jgi:uncharacterized protein with HEPN domain